VLAGQSETSSEVRCCAIALEGPCSAGKTTLGRSLMRSLAERGPHYIVDYCDHVGGGRHLPSPVPASHSEEEAALNKFLYIEWERYATARHTSPSLLLIDRSVETLAAHCRGLTALTGVDYRMLVRRVLAPSTVAVWPSAVLYLDVPTDLVRVRGARKFAPDSVFMNEKFNDGLRRYFVSRRRSVPVAFLDATKSREDLHTEAMSKLSRLLPSPQ
jgi:thymidylate kinase